MTQTRDITELPQATSVASDTDILVGSGRNLQRAPISMALALSSTATVLDLPDGQDVTSALQAMPTEGTVIIPSGTHQISDEIRIDQTGPLRIFAEAGSCLEAQAILEAALTIDSGGNPYPIEVYGFCADLNHLGEYGLRLINTTTTMEDAARVRIIAPTLMGGRAGFQKFTAGIEFLGGYENPVVMQADIEDFALSESATLGQSVTPGTYFARGITGSNSGADPDVSFPRNLKVLGGRIANIWSEDLTGSYESGATIGYRWDQDAIALVTPHDNTLTVEGVAFHGFGTRAIKTKTRKNIVNDNTFCVAESELGAVRAIHGGRHCVDLQGGGGRIVGNRVIVENAACSDVAQASYNDGEDTGFIELINNTVKTDCTTQGLGVFFNELDSSAGTVSPVEVRSNRFEQSGINRISRLADLITRTDSDPRVVVDDNAVDFVANQLVSMTPANVVSGNTGFRPIELTANRLTGGTPRDLVSFNENTLMSGARNAGFSSDIPGQTGTVTTRKILDTETAQIDVLQGATSGMFSLISARVAESCTFAVDAFGDVRVIDAGSAVAFTGATDPGAAASLNVWFAAGELNVRNAIGADRNVSISAHPVA